MPTCLTRTQTAYKKAANAELAHEYDEAFRLYIKAAEGFLHLSRSTSSGNVNHDEKSKMLWKKEAAKALERAEKIKDAKGTGSGGVRAVEVDHWSEGLCCL